MKKTYIAPSVKVQKIDATQMICESLGVGNTFRSGNAVLGKDRGSRQSDDDDFDDLW